MRTMRPLQLRHVLWLSALAAIAAGLLRLIERLL
jgi:hypothetical protein